MARITIEDCMEQVPNRFHLVRMASIRAKQLKKGARPLLIAEDNKEVVTSLREIAAGLVKPGDIEDPVLADLDALAPAPAEETGSIDASSEAPADASSDAPADAPSDAPSDASSDAATAAAADASSDAPADAPADAGVDVAAEEPAEG
jgi:DNA-directed RNA polymerase subunit omega